MSSENTKLHGIIEWEEQNREYPEEDKIWGDLIDILQTDNVDLIILNRTSANVAASALRGLPLAIKDRKLYLAQRIISPKIYSRSKKVVF